MKCKYNTTKECPVFINVANCWYDTHYECFTARMEREKQTLDT
jgi:hypothetical protein